MSPQGIRNARIAARENAKSRERGEEVVNVPGAFAQSHASSMPFVARFEPLSVATPC